MPGPAGFLAAARKAGCPLDPERVSRLIRLTKPAWEIPGSRFVAVRIVPGGARGVATVLWDAELEEPVTVIRWEPGRPKHRPPRDRFGHPGERGRPVGRFRMSEVE